MTETQPIPLAAGEVDDIDDVGTQVVPPPPAPLTRRQETLRCVRQGLVEKDTACIVQVIELIRAITLQADQISVFEMAEIVGRDLTTMNHLLRTACCVGYNPDGIEITSLPQAVQLVGFERIRNIAVSLLLLQNADRPWSDDDFEEIATVMLTGALLAEAIAENRNNADSGICFLSAALRSYGRLLLASFLPEDYREALQHATQVGETAAFREIFDIGPEELGRLLLGEYGFPESLLRNLDPAPAPPPEGRPLSKGAEAHLIVDFGSGVAELFAKSTTREDFEQGFSDRLSRIGRSLNCPRDSLVRALESVMHRMDGYKHSLSSPVFSNRALQNIRALLASEPFPVRHLRRRLPSTANGDIAFVSGGRAEDHLRQGLSELNRVIAIKPLNRAAAWSTAARLMWRSLDLENCFVLLRHGAIEFTAEYGFGSKLAVIRESARLSSADRTVFSVSLLRGRDALIQRPHDPSIVPFVPDWLKPLATGALFVLPVTDPNGTFALLVGLAPEKHTFALSPKTTEHLQLLRRQLGALSPPVSA
jgi:HD-like signal output (HDOD) protein